MPGALFNAKADDAVSLVSFRRVQQLWALVRLLSEACTGSWRHQQRLVLPALTGCGASYSRQPMKHIGHRWLRIVTAPPVAVAAHSPSAGSWRATASGCRTRASGLASALHPGMAAPPPPPRPPSRLQRGSGCQLSANLCTGVRTARCLAHGEPAKPDANAHGSAPRCRLPPGSPSSSIMPPLALSRSVTT